MSEDFVIQRITNTLSVLREDLLPFSFGGNKFRIASELLKDCRKKGKNCIIGYGGIHSNFNRIISSLCSANGMPCYLVCPLDSDENHGKTYNLELSNLSGANIVFCKKNNVSSTIEETFKKCESLGLNPYYVFGDKYGHGNEKVLLSAYANLFKKINLQGNYDYIFLATGTGMTQAGLIAGKLSIKAKTTIVGISVARNRDDEKRIINSYLNSFFDNVDSYDSEINVIDDFVFGGYGIYNEGILECIKDCYTKYGIPLDPIYTGKAFYGLTSYLKKGGLQDKKVLFVHTGGTPLFFDYIGEESFRTQEISSEEDLLDFLKNVDEDFPIPLSSRVDLKEYARKVLMNGKVVGVKREGKVVSAALFYCNDRQDNNAFVTSLATIKEYRGKGLSSKVLNAAIEYAKKEGMKTCSLETNPENNKAIALYSKLGFRIVKVDKIIQMKKVL